VQSGWAHTDEARVVILDNGDRRSAVLRIVRDFSGLGLMAAAELIDRPLTRIPVRGGEPIAQRLAGLLERAGATVVIELDGPPHDDLADLERLGELHARGVLDDAEFSAAKQRVLDRI
jgi:hypothetical protein